MSGPGYSESYTYDAIGRPARTTYNADATYHVDYAYSATTGYLDNVTYPTSTASYRLRPQLLYTHGILSQIRDFNAPATVWWQLNAEDDRGYPVDEEFENGVHALSHFDGMTGHLDWRMSGNNPQFNNHQNLTFEWDKNENLDKRIDVNQANLTERFFYDALDRLDYSTLNGATNLDVGLDASGNITSKTTPSEPLSPSNVGSYTYYPGTHAVASTSNGWTFTYDANGNMLTGRDAEITWYSYNLPHTIANGSLASEFFYTPDGAYWQQDADYAGGFENTIYIGGLLEKVSRPTGTEYRHMIRAGTNTIIVSRHGNGTNETYNATGDHLGTAAVVTKSDGAEMVTENSGAYGARRGRDWQGSPSAADWAAIANTTRRGFTEHTMADNVTLIHMNGRMYDPLIGRFISADPFVPAPYHSQSLNRYSYVWNNPASLVDPSGFQPEDDSPGDLPEGACPPSNPCPKLNPACWHPLAGGWVCRPGNAPDGVVDIIPIENTGGFTFAFGTDISSSAGGGATAPYWVPRDFEAPPLPSEFVVQGKGRQSNWLARLDPLFCDCDYKWHEGDFDRMLAPLPPAIGGTAKEIQLIFAAKSALQTTGNFVRGMTVIGRYPTYKASAQASGARYFDLGKLGNLLPNWILWRLNTRFLDQAVARGDRIVLARPFNAITDAGSWLADEIAYLSGRHGYVLVDNIVMVPR